MDIHEYVMIVCALLLSGYLFLELCSLLEAFNNYLDSVTEKNEEQARFYAAVRDKQELLSKKILLSIEQDYPEAVMFNTERNKDEISKRE